MVVDSKRSSEIGLLAQIEKLIGWLAGTETARQHLGHAAVALRSCFVEEAKLEQRIHAALTQLQQHVMRVRSGPIRKLLKGQSCACEIRPAAAPQIRRKGRRTLAEISRGLILAYRFCDL